MDYVSLIGAVGGVIAAIYSAMAYYQIRIDDHPTLHVRFLEPIGDGVYHLMLEIHPGKRPARYSSISIRGGRIGPAISEWDGGIRRVTAAQDLRRSYDVNLHVPSAIARDAGPELSLVLSMRKKAVVSIRTGRNWLSSKIKTPVMESMIDSGL